MFVSCGFDFELIILKRLLRRGTFELAYPVADHILAPTLHTNLFAITLQDLN